MDYSTTVHLPTTVFPMKADLPKCEPGFLARWDEEQIYQKGLDRRRGSAPTFILHDGPPYANGRLHLGHALNKILKDIIIRFKTMTGHFAPYVPGWDCHGLPIELQLMKELKVSDKHAVDRAHFRQQAKAFAEKFVDLQRQEFKRMGVLGDWEKPYLTMAEPFKKVIVECFEDLRKQGYIYRGKKPVYWCSTDETALAEAEVEYENDPSPAIFVAFPFDREKPGTSPGNATPDLSGSEIVIWTTTPWTLPSNQAVAVLRSETYIFFKTDTGRKLILAKKRLEDFVQKTGIQGQTIAEFPGSRLAEHATFKNPFHQAVPVLAGDFVSMDAGTGVVHIAPGHGREDYQLGTEYKLDILSPIDDRGRFTEAAQNIPKEWIGLHVFKANPLVVEYLKQHHFLLHAEEIIHSYPHCWRCHRPVIFRATEQWFMNIEHKNLRQELMKAIDTVEWIPKYGKNRIAGMIESRPDWCLSRQRLWGTEIPEMANGTDAGEGAEFSAVNGRKDPDIFDVWFESGVSWAAVLRQPSPWPDLQYPADLYVEGSDQHRGWFQTSLIPSVALEHKAPYKAVLTHGFVMDGQGRPMSKSLGNVISPDEVIKVYGADVLRLWVASSDYSGDIRLSPEILKGLADTYRKVRNTFRYLLGNLSGFKPDEMNVAFAEMPAIDRWALSKLRQEAEAVRSDFAQYDFHRGVSRLVHFCTSALSGFYLDGLKDRLYCDATASLSRRSAQTVLWHLADALIKVWAPILSFTCDEAWRNLGHTESVHLADWSPLDSSWNDLRLDEVFPIREKILEALEKARQGGRIKGNLEANVRLYSASAATAELLKRYAAQWASFCLTSQASIASAPLSEPEMTLEDLQIKVEKADGEKCARCWIFKVDVGSQPPWPAVCGRCASVLKDRPV